MDLNGTPPLGERYERIACDVVCNPNTAVADDASFPVEQYEIRYRERLEVGSLLLDEPALS